MGLKDMFRRKSAKGSGKRAEKPEEPRRRGASEATVMISADGASLGRRDPNQATGDSPVAPTSVIRSPIADVLPADRSPDDTTERLVPSDSDATVAVAIPNFDEASPEPADATVAVPIRSLDDATTPFSAPAGAADATVAVSIPNFDPTGDDDSSEDTQQLRSAESETTRKPVPPVETSSPELADATVAVPIPRFDDEQAGPDPSDPAPADATVAVPILDLEPSPALTSDVAAALDATVAVPIPSFDDAVAEPPMPVAQEQAPDFDPNDATRFDLPDTESPLPRVTGVLVAIDGDLAGVMCAIRDGETKLGRSESCDVVLSSMKISREHVHIVHQDGVFAILALSQRNPTYVNGEAIEGCELSDGDSVRMGRTTFRFRTIEGS